jgi:mediator of replication checkpoint protein 1
VVLVLTVRFLTQTRPAGRETTQSEPTQGEGELPGSPEGLVKSSSTLLNSTHSDGPSHEDLDMPSPEGDGHYGRLRRRGSDDDDGYDGADATSPSPIKPKPKSKNAFDALQRGAAREARRADLAKHKPAFLDEQAEESDEDDGWGMNGGGGKDDEDDEDLDNGYVPELLDDAEVEEGEKSMQAALAAEKFRNVKGAQRHISR